MISKLSFYLLDRSLLCTKRMELTNCLIYVTENCVAQKKSNATMKYARLQSLIFYERVPLICNTKILLYDGIPCSWHRKRTFSKKNVSSFGHYVYYVYRRQNKCLIHIICKDRLPIFWRSDSFLNIFFANMLDSFTEISCFLLC